MEIIFRNQYTHNYDISITAEEWIKVLSSREIQQAGNVLDALEKMYLEPEQTSSCKALSEKFGKKCNYYSVQNKIFGEITLRLLNKYKLIGDNGKETFWGVAWLETRREKGIMIVKLRPELIEAIDILGLFNNTSAGVRNIILQKDFSDCAKFNYLYQKRQKTDPKLSTSVNRARSAVSAMNALSHSEFKCEYDASHESFPRIADGKPYLETHHLIPLEFSGDFDYSIDIPENIVCLCSRCHDRIHFGRDRGILVKKLWELRKDDLAKSGIDITYEALIKYYHISAQ